MKKLVLLLVVLGCYPALAQTISITNNAKSDRNEAVVEISWADIQSKNPTLDPSMMKIVDVQSKAEIPFQLEKKGGNSIVNLLIQASIKGKTTADFKIEKGKPTAFTSKTFARYVPERLDDFAWENDKIAFRTYGKALEGTKGDAYGFDVWVKRTSDLIIDRRYKHGDYHHDLGDGLDYYHVGLTLGAGNIAPIVGDKIAYSANYHRWKVLDNGPLRTSFRLEYDEWKVADKPVKATKTITIDAGSQLYKVEAAYTFSTDSLPLAIGIIKRPETGIMTLNEQEGIMAYWEPKHGEDGTTAVGVYIPAKVHKMTVTDEQLLAHVVAQKNKPFVYYTGAAWDKAGEITKPIDWTRYMNEFRNRLQSPLKVKIK